MEEKNLSYSYTLCGSHLIASSQEKDSSVKISAQYAAGVRKANLKIGWIRNGMVYNLENITVPA